MEKEERATSSRAGEGATKKTSPESTLLPRSGAASPESQSAQVQVRKLSNITLPSAHRAELTFGKDSFIVGFENDPHYHCYRYYDNQYRPFWTKPIPDGLATNSYKQLSETQDIYINRNVNEVWRYNKDLQLIDKLPSPGAIIGLFHGCQDALIDNWGQITEEEDQKVYVAPLTNLLDAHHYLDIPLDGTYRRKCELLACGRQNGWVVVVAYKEPFIDFYSEQGRHIRRAQLPHGAGWPGCSDTHVLVPLCKKPQICIFNWSGDLLQTLGEQQLGLCTVDEGYVVSPVLDGRFSFWTYSTENQIHTYALSNRGEDEAISSGGAEGATSSRLEERAMSSRAGEGATKKTSPGSTLLARSGAASLESQSAHVQVIKLSHISLPWAEGAAHLTFGQDSFIMGFKNDPNYHFYKFSYGSYYHLWTKPIPEGLLFTTNKQVSENLDIYFNRFGKEVWRYNKDLKLIDKLPCTGRIIGLLTGGQDAIMDNWAQITEEDDMMVSVAPLTNLLDAHHYLAIPRDGTYKRKDLLHARGLQNGPLVVVAWTEPFVDFYSYQGRHIRRAQLPEGAGEPGISVSDVHVLVPLWKKPQICVFNWSGDLLYTLSREPSL